MSSPLPTSGSRTERVTVEVAVAGSLRAPAGNPVGRGRVVLGRLLAVLLPAAVALFLHLTRDSHALATVVLLMLVGTVVVALVGGLRPALLSAVLSGLLSNVLFTEPYFDPRIASEVDVVTVLVQVMVAVAVSTAVDRAARGRVEAARARAEADALTAFARSVLAGHDSLEDLLEQLRSAFGMTGVDLVVRPGPPEVFDAVAPAPTVLATVGSGTDDPARVSAAVDVAGDVTLRLAGPGLHGEEVRVVAALATQVAAVLERDRLRAEAGQARAERERTRTRTALLRAVSHDLRTPLAGIKAGVSTLRSPDIVLTPEDQAALLADVEAATDRLQALIDNLLDMSRLDAGAVVPRPRPVAVEDVVARALAGMPHHHPVEVALPADLPLLHADAGLLERAVGNVVENAVRHAGDAAVRVSARRAGREVVLRVADEGPGLDPARRRRIFEPFQRTDDAGGRGSGPGAGGAGGAGGGVGGDGAATAPGARAGVGLGLAVAKGLAEVTGGSLTAEETPGGGLTLVFRLPVAADRGPERPDELP